MKMTVVEHRTKCITLRLKCKRMAFIAHCILGLFSLGIIRQICGRSVKMHDTWGGCIPAACTARLPELQLWFSRSTLIKQHYKILGSNLFVFPEYVFAIVKTTDHLPSITPSVACPDRSGWSSIFIPSNIFKYSHCYLQGNSVLVTRDLL